MEPLTLLSDGALQLITICSIILLHTLVTSSAWSHTVPHGWGQGLSATYWGSGVHEASEGLSSGNWNRTMAHNSHAWCQFGRVGRGASVCITLRKGVHGVWIHHSTANSKLDSPAARCPMLEQERQAGRVHGDRGLWGVCAMRVWVWMSFCSKPWARPAGKSGTQGVGKRVWSPGRGIKWTEGLCCAQGICDSACACEPGHGWVCAHTGDLWSLPAPGEEGTVLSVLLWCESYVGTAPLCSQPCPCPVRVLCVRDKCSTSLWDESEKEKGQPYTPAWAETPGLWGTSLGSRDQAGESLGTDQLEVGATTNNS